MNDKVDDIQIDFTLENVEEEDGKFIFSARSITKDFICEDGLQRLADDSKGKHLIWRHEHPVNPKYNSTHIYGRVLDSVVDDKGILSRYEVYGHTEEHMKAREDIKKRDIINEPLSISMRYRQYGEDDKPIHLDVVEHSLTPTPACEECIILDILNEENKMENKEKIIKQIKELEDELTKKDNILEKLTEKVKTLGEEISTKDVALEKEKTDGKKVFEQLVEFKDKLNEQKTMIDTLNENLAFKKVEPFINKLVKLDGPFGEKMRPLYLKQAQEEGAVEFFKEAILEKEKVPKAVTTSLDKTANESKDVELEDEPTKKVRDGAFANMPEEFFGRGEK